MIRRLRRNGIALLALCAFVPVRATPALQGMDGILDAAIRAAEAATCPARHLSPPVGHVDRRLRLDRCDVPLRAAASSHRIGATRITVQVSCEGRIPWRVWVPVTVKVLTPVVVARHALARGSLLAAGDLAVAERSLAGPGSYATDPAPLVGRRVRADVPAGQPVSATNTTADRLVQRGQQVTLLTSVAGIKVTATGEAQSDAGLGARIRVRSASSARVIEGVVRSSEVVEVLLPGGGSG